MDKNKHHGGNPLSVKYIKVGDVQLEQANETVYVPRVRFSENGRMESELNRRIGRAATVVRAVRRTVFGNRELSSEAIMTVYNAVVVPILVYGCEAWVLKDRDQMRLQATEIEVLRRVVGVTRLGCVRNEVV